MNLNFKTFYSSAFCLTLIVLLSLSCTKDENSAPVASFTWEDNLDEIILYDNSSDADGDILSHSWEVNDNRIDLIAAITPQPYFRLPDLDNPLDVEVTLTVNDDSDTDVTTQTITVPVLTQIRSYGLGIECSTEKSNNVDYDWYIDQANTGQYSGINCGPASTTMSIKWANPNFSRTAEDARNFYLPDLTGWWYTSDIVNYLNYYEVNNFILSLNPGIGELTRELDAGNIAILCLDMYYITYQEKERWRVDKFYTTDNTGWGHFIVAKGYKIVDEELYIEVYDPNNYSNTNADGTLKGKDRYYRANDISKSAEIWWNYAIVVSKDEVKSSKGLDPNTIIHNKGR